MAPTWAESMALTKTLFGLELSVPVSITNRAGSGAFVAGCFGLLAGPRNVDRTLLCVMVYGCYRESRRSKERGWSK